VTIINGNRIRITLAVIAHVIRVGWVRGRNLIWSMSTVNAT